MPINPIIHQSSPFLQRKIIQKETSLTVQSWSPESYFTMPYRWIGAKSTGFLVTERQGYYRPVKGVGLRNPEPQDFKCFSNYLSTTQIMLTWKERSRQ